jgi:hypothetical protein
MAMSETSARAEHAHRSVRELAADVKNEIPDRLRTADAWLRDVAERQPLLALGVALAAGYAAGRLLPRR